MIIMPDVLLIKGLHEFYTYLLQFSEAINQENQNTFRYCLLLLVFAAPSIGSHYYDEKIC